jgi:hypothetical protein
VRKFLFEHQRLINGLAILSAFGVVLITVLRFLPPAFEHANVIADTLFDLSVGYLGAWLFNLLVIEIPRHRVRVQAFWAIHIRLGLYLVKTPYEVSAALVDAITDDAQKRQELIARNQVVFRKRNLSDPGDEEYAVSLFEAYANAKPQRQASARHVIESLRLRNLHSFSLVETLVLTYFDVEMYMRAQRIADSPIFTVI